MNRVRFRSRLRAGAGSGGGGAALPQVGNIAAKWTADSITPQADNTTLTSWTETVSATALPALGTPKYRTNRVGGMPSVQFDGASCFLGAIPALKTLMDAGTYSLMIVCSNVFTQANATLFANSAGGDSCMFQATGAAIGRYQNGQYPFTDNTKQITYGYSSQNSQRYPQQTNAVGERSYAYGLCVRTNQAKSPVTSGTGSNFGIGAVNASVQLPLKADIQEIIIWNRVLTEMEWLQAAEYVEAKYTQPLPIRSAAYLAVFDGDSITQGTLASTVGGMYPVQSAAALGLALGQWTLQAIGGMTTRGMTLKLSEWSGIAARYSKPQKVAAFEWYNEKNNGYTPAVQYSDMQAYCAAVRALASTKLALGDSTGYVGDPDPSGRDTYNTLMAGGAASNSDAYVSISSNATIGTTGAYASGSATYWGGDGVHLSNAGYAVLAPLMTAGIQAM